MAYCFYCGEEIYIILPFLRTKDCYCEKCKRITTVVTHRKTNEAELDKARREYQKNYFLHMKPGMSYEQVVDRILAQKAYKSNIIMFHPDERDRDSRLVYSYDPKKGGKEK